MKLNFRKYGEGEPLIILHGLFGSLDNWVTLANRFSEKRAVYVVDQRNHGQSPHDDEMNYSVMADDLYRFIQDHDLGPSTILGHSMGGKTAMYFAQKYTEFCKAIIVVDIGIKDYPPHHQAVLEAFEAIQPETLESRRQAEERISPIISDEGTRLFLLKNLYRRKDGTYGIRANYQVAKKRMADILAPVPKIPVDVPALFIVGGKSDYIMPEDHDSIRDVFTAAKFVTLDTGHWVQAEDPDGVFEAVENFVTV